MLKIINMKRIDDIKKWYMYRQSLMKFANIIRKRNTDSKHEDTNEVTPTPTTVSEQQTATQPARLSEYDRFMREENFAGHFSNLETTPPIFQNRLSMTDGETLFLTPGDRESGYEYESPRRQKKRRSYGIDPKKIIFPEDDELKRPVTRRLLRRTESTPTQSKLNFKVVKNPSRISIPGNK